MAGPGTGKGSIEVGPFSLSLLDGGLYLSQNSLSRIEATQSEIRSAAGYSVCPAIASFNQFVGNTSASIDAANSSFPAATDINAMSKRMGLVGIAVTVVDKSCSDGFSVRDGVGLLGNMAGAAAATTLVALAAPEVIGAGLIYEAGFFLMSSIGIVRAGDAGESALTGAFDFISWLTNLNSINHDSIPGLSPVSNEEIQRVASSNPVGPEAALMKAARAGDSAAEAKAVLQIPYIYGDPIIQRVAGGQGGVPKSTADLTSLYTRQIGVDAFVHVQQLAAARADAAINGHHPDDGGGSDRDRSPTTGSDGGTKSTVASTSQTAATNQADCNQNYDRDRQSGTTYSAQAQDPYRSGVQPILFDLNGNGVELATLDRSTTFLDSNGDGLQHRTAWAGTGDGVLFFDAGNDGKISEKREYVFTEWDPTAKDDMAALRARFDSNGDGKLTSADAAWSSFKVMVTNADGSQTAKTLTELGITEINLVPNATHVAFDDGSEITGQTTFVMGGVTKTAAAVTLVSEADGHQVVQTVSSTGADNRTVVSVTSDAAWRRLGRQVFAGAELIGRSWGERGVLNASCFCLPSVSTRGEMRVR